MGTHKSPYTLSLTSSEGVRQQAVVYCFDHFLINFYIIMARFGFAIVLFLAAGALAMPQKNGEVKAPEPVEAESLATTSAPAPPVAPEEKIEKPVEKPVEKPIELPVEEPVKKVKKPAAKVAPPPPPKPEPKPAPKPVDVAEPKEAEPAKPDPKPEPEAENETTPKAAESTCVEKYRNCLEKANWAVKNIADCTLNAGSCLGGRLGIEF